VLYSKLRKTTSHNIDDKQAWIKENEYAALNSMQTALTIKRQDTNTYIKFINQFGPAVTGVAFWNNNKTTKKLSDLLTISDEAFIHLCIINYSATWKAQEKKKSGETNIEIPVSSIHCQCWFEVIVTSQWLTALSSLPVSKVHQGS
jgi:hypothetical protein